MTNSFSHGGAVAFFAPRHRMAEIEELAEEMAEEMAERCRAREWLVSCHPLSRAAIAEAFARGCAIVGWCPPAILIRAVPWSDKHRDSPVLCFPPVAQQGQQKGQQEGQQKGQSVLLALSGWHHGGRALARDLEQVWQQRSPDDKLLVVGGSATEEGLGFSLEDLPRGWKLLGDADKVLKALLPSLDGVGSSKDVLEIVGEACGGFPPQRFFDLASGADEQADGQEQRKLKIVVGFLKSKDKAKDADLQLVPRCVTVGVGCVRGASCADIAELVDGCLAEADIEPASVAGIASVSLKRDERGLLQFAQRRGLPLRFFPSEHLSQLSERHGLAGSEAVARAVGTPSVAEAAALALAFVLAVVPKEEGAGERLLLPKRKSAKVVCALALAPSALFESALAGEKNGLLTLVGLGPGSAQGRTAAAVRALREADCVVGYEGYVDLLEQGETRAELHRSAIGSEEERCRQSLALARAGKITVLLGSGDAGVYGLATLVWQILAEESQDKESQDNIPVEVRQVSGVSAMHALAARLGAPLGDDFCAVSLSDVMTCEATILQRIKAAAQGDFVTALYNPQSRTRRALLPRALALLREHRPPDTPVACGRNIGRKDESVSIAQLQDFAAEAVDMNSIVVVGNSKTKSYDSAYGTRLYTERGYKLRNANMQAAK